MLDTPELRRLVYIADQRRARSGRMPIATVEMMMFDDPRAEEWDERYHEALIASIQANVALIEYLLDALGMRSELRPE